MTDFEDRIRRIVRETVEEMGHKPSVIDDVIEPPGADYCVVTFTSDRIEPIEISRPIGAGESQEKDEIRQALQARLGS